MMNRRHVLALLSTLCIRNTKGIEAKGKSPLDGRTYRIPPEMLLTPSDLKVSLSDWLSWKLAPEPIRKRLQIYNTIEQAWDTHDRAEDLIWWAANVGVNPKVILKAAHDCTLTMTAGTGPHYPEVHEILDGLMEWLSTERSSDERSSDYHIPTTLYTKITDAARTQGAPFHLEGKVPFNIFMGNAVVMLCVAAMTLTHMNSLVYNVGTPTYHTLKELEAVIQQNSTINYSEIGDQLRNTKKCRLILVEILRKQIHRAEMLMDTKAQILALEDYAPFSNKKA